MENDKKITKPNAARASAGYMVGNILIKGLSFLVLPIFARILSTSDFGLYNTFSAYASILSCLIGFGMAASLRNANLRFCDKLGQYKSTILLLVLINSALAFLFAFCLYNHLSFFKQYPLLFWVFMIVQAYGHCSIQILNIDLSLKYNYKTYLIVAFVNTISTICLSLFAIYFIFPDSKGIGRILGSAIPLFAIGLIYQIIVLLKTNKKFDIKMAKFAMAFGFPLIWHYLSQDIAAQFDRIMITNMVGLSESGIYSFIYTVANIFPILFYSTDTVWSVASFSCIKNEDYITLRDKSKIYVMTIWGLGIMMMLFSREIIMLLGGKSYYEGIPMFYPLMIGLFFLFLYTIPVSIEYYHKKTTFIAVMTGISAAANIGLNFLLIPLFGYYVAAYTTAASYILMFIAHWIMANRLSKKIHHQNLFHIKDYLLYIITFVVIAFLILYMNDSPYFKYPVIIIILSIICLSKRKDIAKVVRYFKSRFFGKGNA